jgi:hypothetical protein
MPLVLIVWMIGLSVAVAFWGRNRRFGFWGYFFASLLLTPILGALLVIASGPSPAPQKPEAKAPAP